MQIGLLLPAALLFPLLWGWATYVVVSRIWPRAESPESSESESGGNGSRPGRNPRSSHDVDPMAHNFQI